MNFTIYFKVKDLILFLGFPFSHFDEKKTSHFPPFKVYVQIHIGYMNSCLSSTIKSLPWHLPNQQVHNKPFQIKLFHQFQSYAFVTLSTFY